MEKKIPKKSSLVVLIIFTTFLGFGIGVGVANYYYYRYDFFLPGTYILGQSVAGLTVEKAEELLMEGLVVPERLEFRWQDQILYLPLKKGVTFFDLSKELSQAYDYEQGQDLFDSIRWQPQKRDIHISLEIDTDYLKEGIQNLRPYIDREPEDAQLVIEKGVPAMIPSRVGFNLAVSPSLDETTKSIQKGQFTQIPLQVFSLSPAVTEEDLPDFSYCLASYSTDLDVEQESRNHNIALSLDAIGHIVLEPDSIFSFNETVGKVTKESGYLLSVVLEGNQFVEGVGGGICQVATTLYQTVLRGELEILERNSHSRPVQYVPEGFDAAISYNLLDLKFKNNMEYPLLLTTYMEDSIHFSLYGPLGDPGRTVDIVSEKLETIPPPVVEVPDPEMLKGKEKVIQEGVPGSRYRVYRVIYLEGELKSRQLISVDSYLPVETIVAVGTKIIK